MTTGNGAGDETASAAVVDGLVGAVGNTPLIRLKRASEAAS